MATNHQWCLTVDEWKANFDSWVAYATPDSILELNVFFDIRSTYGEKGLVDEIQDHIQSLLHQLPDFLPIYAENCLTYKVPLSSSNKLKTENVDGEASINLKACLRPMEIFCRIYALKHDIREANTMMRLKRLAEKEHLDQKTFREMVYIFDHVWHLRFMNQVVEYTDLRKVNDVLAINDLTELELQNLTNVLKRVSLFHEKINHDFFDAR
jgi:signal-transduction protein with cAMP-binding, CBS, and nucleotidyltransferase domain